MEVPRKIKDKSSATESCNLWMKFHAAPAVWMALVEIAMYEGRLTITPSRRAISNISGVKRRGTISRCLSLLEEMNWIRRTHQRYGEGELTNVILQIRLLGNDPWFQLLRRRIRDFNFDDGPRRRRVSKPEPEFA